jgi:hypothetical protein
MGHKYQGTMNFLMLLTEEATAFGFVDVELSIIPAQSGRTGISDV